MVIGHSSSMWLTDRAIVQMHVTFCDTQMKVEIFAHFLVFMRICIFGVGHLQIPRVPMLFFSSSRCWNIFCFILLIIWQMVALIFRVRMCFIFTVDIWLWRAKRVEKEWEFGHLTLESKESGKGVRVSSVMFLLIVEGNDVIKKSGKESEFPV